MPQGQQVDGKPKKRIRRTANEINRRFICSCGKAYGSEGSLNQHKKNKGHFSDSVMEVQDNDGMMQHRTIRHGEPTAIYESG